jgi:hypothetical protein
MSPADLPHFSVTATRSGICSGRFDPPFVGDRWCGAIYLGAGRFIWGRFIRVDQAQLTCDFLPDDPSEMNLIVEGGSYPYLDGYWGELADLVLDSVRTWREAEFQLPDAVRVPSTVSSFSLQWKRERPSSQR